MILYTLAITLLLPLICMGGAEGYVRPAQPPHPVIVILEAQPGKEATLREALNYVKEQSLKEASCITYEVFQSIDNDGKFLLNELWTSKEDHAKQFEKDYIKAFSSQLKSLLNKPYVADSDTKN
jgi:quinol monooxygenase YgiN